jgi:hypothetical protein
MSHYPFFLCFVCFFLAQSSLLGYQISFETNYKIILADPLPLIHLSIAINRIPEYTNAVKNANRPAMLVFVRHGDLHPYLLQLLDAAHVTYNVAFFPSQPVVDVMVVTPLNRIVSLLVSKSFDIFYCSFHYGTHCSQILFSHCHT